MSKVCTHTKPNLVSNAYSIVLVGGFNPQIFHPIWFAQEQLLRKSEADAAKIEIVHPDFSAFSTDWLALQVTRDRFTATIKSDVYLDHLKDFLVGSFSILSHTPIAKIGINWEQQVEFRNENDWHNLGHYLAPKSPWKDFIDSPGLRSLSIKGRRSDGNHGYVLIFVEPIQELKQMVKFRVNDHNDLDLCDIDESASHAEMCVDFISKDFIGSIKRSEAIYESLISGFLKNNHFDSGI